MAWAKIRGSVRSGPSWVGRDFGSVALLGIVRFGSAVWILVEGCGLSWLRHGSSSVEHVVWGVVINYWGIS